ncbi:MAG: hypothetical protein WBE22_12040, partial [Halobacteriota archaeon]
DVKEEERAEFNKYTYLTIDPNSTNTLTELLTLFTYRTIDPFHVSIILATSISSNPVAKNNTALVISNHLKACMFS